jgi:hypothetical protein
MRWGDVSLVAGGEGSRPTEQEVLERLGWNIYRIWGTSWYRNRTPEEKLLREAIEMAIDGNGSSTRYKPEAKIEECFAPFLLRSEDSGDAWVFSCAPPAGRSPRLVVQLCFARSML